MLFQVESFTIDDNYELTEHEEKDWNASTSTAHIEPLAVQEVNASQHALLLKMDIFGYGGRNCDLMKSVLATRNEVIRVWAVSRGIVLGPWLKWYYDQKIHFSLFFLQIWKACLFDML